MAGPRHPTRSASAPTSLKLCKACKLPTTGRLSTHAMKRFADGAAVDDPSAPARLHVIFFDSALAHGSCLFRVGPMQLILTLLELGLVNPRLILDDPLAALAVLQPRSHAQGTRRADLRRAPHRS